MLDLIVVMPVYNEQEIITHVVNDWLSALRKLNIRFEINVYNDGSKDDTATVLDGLAAQEPCLRIIHKPNSGHGPTILQGYRDACEKAHFVFQIDSDNEIGPAGFVQFWQERDTFDLIIATRECRNSPPSRALITAISRTTIACLYGPGIPDTNVPFRLMNSRTLKAIVGALPHDLFAPNVIIAGLFALAKRRIKVIAVQYKFRQTGTVSIKHWKLLRSAFRSFSQTISTRMNASLIRTIRNDLRA